MLQVSLPDSYDFARFSHSASQHVTACLTKIHLGPWLPLVQSSADNLEAPHITRHTMQLPGMETDDLRLGRKAMKLNSRPGSWNLVPCWLDIHTISYHCQHGCSVLLPTSVANRALQRYRSGPGNRPSNQEEP